MEQPETRALPRSLDTDLQVTLVILPCLTSEYKVTEQYATTYKNDYYIL